MIDLHCHTNSSDGDLTPEELVELAEEKELKAIAITDHDSVASNERAAGHSQKVKVISGVELSCDDPLFDYEKIDMVGLFVDSQNQKLLKLLEHINRVREENKEEIIEKLKSFGYEIDYEEVKKTVKGTFGRPHIAKYLVEKYPDQFKTVRDVFDQLIGRGKKAFVKVGAKVSFQDAIQIIKEAGGISILAHPGLYPKEESVKFIDSFITQGGNGIETYYPYHLFCKKSREESGQLISFYRNIVKEKNIPESGGGDHHDKEKYSLGEAKVPDEVLEKLLCFKKNL